LQRASGNRATARVIQRTHEAGHAVAHPLARMGYRLNRPLPSTAPTPVLDHSPDQRKWNKTDFYTFWETEQGRALTASEKTTIDRGCIGITANNLEGGGNPSLVEVYDDFAAAHAAMTKYNNGIWRSIPWTDKYAMFGMLFWANQDPDPAVRATPDTTHFKGDPATHRVDMTGYRYLDQPGFVNFDYGFWDESTQCFWHANHKESGPSDPMIVYQSTRNVFAEHLTGYATDRYGYEDFDRVIYGVALSENYNAGKTKALN
jgi:hypothetical protein